MRKLNNRKPIHRCVWLKAALLALLSLLVLCACSGDGDVTPGTDVPGTDAPDTTPPPTEPSINLADYVLVRAEEGEVYVSKIALALQSAFMSALDVDVPVSTDFVKMYPVAEKEIVIGPTSREGSVYTSTVTAAPAPGECKIEHLDARVLVHFSDITGAIAAGETLIRDVVASDKAEHVIEVYRKMLDQTNVYGTALTLKSIFADNMLIQQNKPFTLTGTVTGLQGTFTAQLLLGEEVQQEVPLDIDAEAGTFSATFDAVEGSYRSYTICVRSDTRVYCELKDVLFGELWLATGQSNMAYTMAKDADYPDSYFADEYIRVMRVTKPDGGYASTPLDESAKISWVRGDSKSDMSNITAVGYYCTVKLRESLGVPVGMIFYAVGGTPVRSWISRETIEASPLLSTGALASKYAAPTNWDPEGYRQATALYNSMVRPALGLNIAGILWYQGEQDLGENDQHYTEELELMYLQYCLEYGYKDFELPMVMPIIAPYLVRSRPQSYAAFTANLAAYAAKHDKITVLAINDVSPEHREDNNASHPKTKKPVGERLASAVMAMVYGEKGYTATPPTAESISVSGNVLTVTFSNVADGLTISNGASVLRGFTVCGSDGVYYPANAEIVGRDKVALSSPSVPNPVSATYAYELLTYTANLGCTYRGSLLYMASPFALDMPANASTTTQLLFADCDMSNIWHLTRDTNHFVKYYDAWWAKLDGSTARVMYSKNEKVQGDASLMLDVNAAGTLTVGPTLTGQNDEGKAVVFYEHSKDYSRYSRVTVKIKNNGSKPLTVDSLSFGNYIAVPTAPAVIPGDSAWTEVTFDLTNMKTASGGGAANRHLTAVSQIVLQLTASGKGIIYIDDMQFLK
ncbi:MAG: hypothetical protein IKD37_07225 [Clostridia bacterium]|nr:hypothetical protein [Clostridia bacterium]